MSGATEMTVKRPVGRWRRRVPVLLLMLSALAADLGVNCRNLGTAFQAIAWEASPLALGIIAAAGPGAFALTCLLLGRLSDRLGRRRTAVTGLLLTALCLLGLYLSQQVWHLAVLSGGFGASMALFWPTLSAWFSDLAAGGSRNLNRMLGNFNLAWSTGMVLGAVLGGALWRLMEGGVFLFLVVLLLVVAGGLFAVPQPRPGAAQEAEEEEPVCPLRNGRFLIVARLANFLSWFMTGVILTLLPKLMHLLGMPEDRTGVAVGAFYVAVLLFMYLARTSDCWHYRRWPLALPVPLALLGLVLVSTAEHLAAFVVACFISGTCAALGSVTSLYYSLHGRGEDRAASTAKHEAVVGTGAVLGALVSGVAAELMLLRMPEEAAVRGSFLVVMVVAGAVGAAQLAVWLRWRGAVAAAGAVDKRGGGV